MVIKAKQTQLFYRKFRHPLLPFVKYDNSSDEFGDERDSEGVSVKSGGITEHIAHYNHFSHKTKIHMPPYVSLCTN